MAFLMSAPYSGRSIMDSSGKPAQSHPKHRRPKALVPALLGVAAVTCLSAQALAGAPAMAAAPAKPAAVATTSNQESGLLATYTVKSGDSLSTIATRLYSNPDAWPVIHWANHQHVRGTNSLKIGRPLRIPAKPGKISGAPVFAAADPAPAPVQATLDASFTPALATAATYTGGGSSFQQCVIARESGGNPQVMNASGHYGLYQFSYSTWVEYGGSPSSFGHASVAEQNRVFANAMARGGAFNWAPYDGC
jgi:LysM repeat protein